MSKSLRIALPCVFVLVCLYLSYQYLRRRMVESNYQTHDCKYSKWPEFTHTLQPQGCPISNIQITIETIHQTINKIQSLQGCQRVADLSDRIYSISVRSHEIVLDSEEFRRKVLGWLGNDEQLFSRIYNQTVISVFNKRTVEETMFSPLRSSKPIPALDMPELQYIEELAKKTDGCDFCNVEKMTARDKRGRLHRGQCSSAANVFPFEGKHNIMVAKTHHPLNWSKQEFLDMYLLAKQWLEEENRFNPNFCYGSIIWDFLPHGGASQVHPHVQVNLRPDRYPGVIENWRTVADRYYTEFGSNYFTDLTELHSALGLTVTYKTAVAVASLAPKKENELVILGQEFNIDYLTLFHYAVRYLIEEKKQYTFSMGTALPEFGNKGFAGGNSGRGILPVMTRLVTRGIASEVRSDISGLELFTFSNVNADPFKLARGLQEFIAAHPSL